MPALVTPFRNGALDEESLRKLVEHCIEGGVDGLVPCGTTGESVALEGDEHERVVRIVVEQSKKRVPVVAGAGTVSTHHTKELARACKRAGADGLLLVTPYYNKPTQAGLEAHFRAVLQDTPLPSILYNIPGRTGCDLAVETLEKLSDISAIVGIKEATGNVLRAQHILARFGDRFSVFSGDDALTLSMLALGAVGVISVTANVLPRATSDIVRFYRAGEFEKARALHLKLVSVHDSMFLESNPGPVKAALHARGLLAPELRLPLVWPSAETVSRVVASVGALA